jgi:hypothetical protein
MIKTVILGFLVLAVSLVAVAQSNDLAVVAGAKFTPSASSTSATTTFNSAFAFEGSFAHQIKGFSLLALQVEIPVMVAPNSTLKSSNFFASKSYNSLYFTPGFRLRFAASAPVSPWIAIGGGIVRFNPSTTTQVGGANAATQTVKGVGEVGGGVDFKAPGIPVRLRVEAREYFSGSPNINIPNLSLHNNLFAGIGLMVRF